MRAKERCTNDLRQYRILYIGAGGYRKKWPKRFRYNRFQGYRILYIGSGFLGSLAPDPALLVVDGDLPGVAAAVLGEIPGVLPQPALRVVVESREVARVLYDPVVLARLLAGLLALGSRAGNLARPHTGIRIEDLSAETTELLARPFPFSRRGGHSLPLPPIRCRRVFEEEQHRRRGALGVRASPPDPPEGEEKKIDSCTNCVREGNRLAGQCHGVR